VEWLQRRARGVVIGVVAHGSADAVAVKLSADRDDHAGDHEADVPFAQLADDLGERQGRGVVHVPDGRTVQDHPPHWFA